MKQFAEEYPDFPFVQVPLAQLREMPILQARLAKFTVSADGEFVQVVDKAFFGRENGRYFEKSTKRAVVH